MHNETGGSKKSRLFFYVTSPSKVEGFREVEADLSALFQKYEKFVRNG